MDFLRALPPAFTDSASLFLVALTVSSLGFRRLVYFVSLGYAFSMTGMALLAAWLFSSAMDLPVALQCVALGAYGVRLGTYLVKREKEPGYQRELEDTQQRAVGIGRGKQVAIWLGVSLLYVLMFSPALFNLQQLRAAHPSHWAAWLGLVLMVAGFSLESLADHQKAAFKRAQPQRYCDVKLYRLVRCPNYLGEIVFWIGGFIAGVGAYVTWMHWLAAATGLACIILIMMGSTKRLEGKQEARYGPLPDYQQYVRSVPVLFPFVPVYSLKSVRVYLE